MSTRMGSISMGYVGSKVWVDQNGRERVRCDRSFGLTLDPVSVSKFNKELATDFFLLTKEANPVVLIGSR